jgi:CHASE2 domain-containing sensor protein
VPGGSTSAATERLLQRLGAAQAEAFLVDIRRPHLGIPAMRVLIPRLQPYPAYIATPRLRDARKHFGGGPGERSKIDAL